MSSQPFDSYKNEGVEYDYILQANVKLEEFNDDSKAQLLSLLTNEDFLGIYFTQIALGRVYSKYEYLNDKLHFTFGISLVDAPEKVTSKDLIDDIKEFILSLNKNIIQTPKLKIKEGDIKVEILSENKAIIDNIDKRLVNESTISFTNGNNVQSLVLTSDGIVEKYINNTLNSTMPFSKLGVIRECKSLIANGYSLTIKTEAEIQNNIDNSNVLDNPEQTKQELQQDIKDIDEIQDLKDELEDKLNTLYEEVDSKNYVVAIYTKIGNDYKPDVLISGVENSNNGNVYVVADDIESAAHYTQEMAESIAQNFIDETVTNDTPQFIAKAISVDDLDSLEGLYENRVYGIQENNNINDFPSNEFTQEVKTANQLSVLTLEKDLSLEQINWLQEHIGNIYEIEDGLRNFAAGINRITEPIISLDDYFNKLYNMLKGE